MRKEGDTYLEHQIRQINTGDHWGIDRHYGQHFYTCKTSDTSSRYRKSLNLLFYSCDLCYSSSQMPISRVHKLCDQVIEQQLLSFSANKHSSNPLVSQSNGKMVTPPSINPCSHRSTAKYFPSTSFGNSERRLDR